MDLKAHTVIMLFKSFMLVKCGDFIPDKVCAALFSQHNFEGARLELKDFDQAVNLKKEYRHSLNGWQKTGSIRVEHDCKVTVCSDSYFEGDCQSFNSNAKENMLITFDVNSINCTCKRICSCKDVPLPQNHKSNGYFGRIYPNGACETCDSEYRNLAKESLNFFDEIVVDGFKLADGCSVTLYAGTHKTGNSITIHGPEYQTFHKPIGSYSAQCDKSLPESNYNDLILTQELPDDFDALQEAFISEPSLSQHPSFQAALKSAGNGRSSNSAYVVLVGAPVPYWLGFPQCRGTWENYLWQCDIKVWVKDLQIFTELHVIVTPIGYAKGINGITVKDYKIMATLEQLLIENSVLPNAVIIYHYLDRPKDDYIFHYKLQFVHSLSAMILDESYPNVIFLFDNFDLINETERKKRPMDFEKFINEIWEYPPTICLTSKLQLYTPFVNGYQRLKNMEYWPKNLETYVDNICEMGGDPLGRAIFKAFFQDKKTPYYSTTEHTTYENLAKESTIGKYREMFPIPNIENKTLAR